MRISLQNRPGSIQNSPAKVNTKISFVAAVFAISTLLAEYPAWSSVVATGRQNAISGRLWSSMVAQGRPKYVNGRPKSSVVVRSAPVVAYGRQCKS